MPSYQWYYATDGAQAGPVEEAELKRLVAAGKVKTSDLVWRDGFGDWVPASKVKALFDAPAGAPAPAGPIGAVLPSIPARPTPSQTPLAPGATSPRGPASVALSATYPAVAPTASPYQPASAAAVLPYQGGGSGYGNAVSSTAVDLLRQTRPWVLLFSVLMFIVAGLTFLGGIVMVFAGMAAPGPRGPNRAFNSGFALGSMCAGLIPMVAGLLYFFPALYLARYAGRIRNLVASSRTEDLESALDAQKSFWRFIGILTVIVIAFYLLMILLMIIVAAAGASGSRGGRGF